MFIRLNDFIMNNIILPLTAFIIIFYNENLCSQTEFPNPSAVYCIRMCYKYVTRTEPLGEDGYVIFPDSSECRAWDFFRGLCGKQFSYCAQMGYYINIIKKDMGSYTISYAVCYNEHGDTIKMQELIDSLGLKMYMVLCTTGTL